MELTKKEMELQKLINLDVKFWADYCNENLTMHINGVKTPTAYYNLLVSIRDCGLWSIGMKPHRFFKITDVKKYFGLKGSSKTYANQLRNLADLLQQNVQA